MNNCVRFGVEKGSDNDLLFFWVTLFYYCLVNFSWGKIYKSICDLKYIGLNEYKSKQ